MKIAGIIKCCITLWIIAVFHLAELYGQFYVTGDPPSSVRWSRVNTDAFQVIFPDSLYYQANHFANLLEASRDFSGMSTGKKHTRMPVVIHNASVLSNGYVSWAPKRMEIVAPPSQDFYSGSWLSQLALHEYRHVFQLESMNQGFTRFLSFFTGQISTGLASATIPPWLYEGDAVVNETLFSLTGRGRLPGFQMPLRALLLEDKNYSYDKAFFGSYRDFVPDHYIYGYQLVSYGRDRYGDDFWNNAFRYAARNTFLISPLALYLKKYTGTVKSGFYNHTIDYIKDQYNSKISSINYTDYLIVNSEKKKLY